VTAMRVAFSSTFSSSRSARSVRWFQGGHPWLPVVLFRKALILQNDWIPLSGESVILCSRNTVVSVSTICSRLPSSLMISTFGMVNLRTLSPRPHRELCIFQGSVAVGLASQTGLRPL
jgi:hypothetical protein